MAELSELLAMRDALRQARYSGNRRVRTSNSEIEFKTDGEMAAALADLESRIAALSDQPRPSILRVSLSKGL